MAGNIGEPNAIDAETKVQGIKGNFYSGTLSGALTLDGTYGSINKLDPGGAHRDVTLWPVATREGVLATFINAADAAENLVLKNVGGDTIATVNQNEAAHVFCDGSTWALAYVQTIALS